MAKKTKGTKTTRNDKLNFYYTQDSYGNNFKTTVVSTTATSTDRNIRLLDSTDYIMISGTEIKSDAANNSTMIEINTELDSKTAKIISQLASIDPTTLDEEAKILYDAQVAQIDKLLKKLDTSFEKVKEQMIINTSVIEEKDGTESKQYYIFGAPEKSILNNRQNYNNCGVESTLNTLARAGIINMKSNLSDQKSVEKSFLNKMLNLGLVQDEGTIGKLDFGDGGTLPDDYRDMLALYGIESESYFLTNAHNSTNVTQYGTADGNLCELAYKISQGHGAVLGVCSEKFWNETDSESGKTKIDHAIAITGVVYDTKEPTATTTPVGFYIHDSGAWMTRFISLEDFKKAALYDYVYGEKDDEENKTLSSLEEDVTDENGNVTQVQKTQKGIFITITTEPILSKNFNLNATGNKYANIIYGNTLSNTIKGMAGNDTLYGGAGDDKIYGGKGNDIIFGNGVGENDISSIYEYLSENDKTRISKVSYVKDADSDNNMFGSNTLYGDAGSDIIFGGNGADLIYGGAGNDYIYGGLGRNAIYGGKGNDVIIGGNGDERLFGDAGNDTIYGGFGDDTIHGGAGNDKIYGGLGNDRIETGKGNDTVYVEGKNYGVDLIFSQGGSTNINFVDRTESDTAAKLSDMYFSLEENESNPIMYDFSIYYEADSDNAKHGVGFSSLYNSKTKKSQNLTLNIEDKTYRVSGTNAKKATVADTSTKTKGGHDKINNLLLSLNTDGATITTSKKDDVVCFIENESKSDLSYKTRKDKITYTGGNDRYISKEGNTYYTVSNFGANSNLSIFDNIQELDKKDLIEGKEYTDLLDPDVNIDDILKDVKVVSTDDRLYMNVDKSKTRLFFDVAIDGSNKAMTTSNTGLYLVYSDENTDMTSVYNSIAASGSTNGLVYMDSFYGADKTFESSSVDIFGNGRIENFYFGGVQDETFDSNYAYIAEKVAVWLSSHTEYSSAFDAFKNAKESSTDLSGLIAAYNYSSATAQG